MNTRDLLLLVPRPLTDDLIEAQSLADHEQHPPHRHSIHCNEKHLEIRSILSKMDERCQR